tara:strand:+ start:1152 stop:1334 length:183 start_codon:yes stop_codon:yes gene_type:complete
MVAFARAQAKSIFSMLRFKEMAKTCIETNETTIKKDPILKKTKNSHYFLEAIKNGGIWLS